MNDTLFVNGDTILTLEHAKIPDMPTEFTVWPMYLLAFSLGVLCTLIVVVYLGHRRIQKLDKAENQRLAAMDAQLNSLVPEPELRKRTRP